MKYISKIQTSIYATLNDNGKRQEIAIHPGEPVELPEENTYVKGLEERGIIEKISEEKKNSKKTV